MNPTSWPPAQSRQKHTSGVFHPGVAPTLLQIPATRFSPHLLSVKTPQTSEEATPKRAWHSCKLEETQRVLCTTVSYSLNQLVSILVRSPCCGLDAEQRLDPLTDSFPSARDHRKGFDRRGVLDMAGVTGDWG